jgi:hypothetical protein
MTWRGPFAWIYKNEKLLTKQRLAAPFLKEPVTCPFFLLALKINLPYVAKVLRRDIITGYKLLELTGPASTSYPTNLWYCTILCPRRIE